MKKFTNVNLKTLRKQIDTALAGVAKKNGISLSIGRISYQAESFRTKLEAVIQNSENAGLSVGDAKELKELKMFGDMFGLDESHLGNTFSSHGETFKFTGIKTSRPKYPISGTSVRTGKSFKFTESVVSQITKK